MDDILIHVDEQDNFLGYIGKTEAHLEAVKHRAFSIFIFNDKQEMLIQQRALDKYHTPGLWSNTCCSHPRYGENLTSAVHRRLPEEMGFDTELFHVHEMSYRVEFENGITENEYDHVYIGFYQGQPHINPVEVNSYKWISRSNLLQDMDRHPEKYTFWFKKIMSEFDFNKAIDLLKNEEI